MMTNCTFEPLKDSGTLASRLADIASRHRLSNVCIGLQISDRQMFAATDAAACLRTSEAAQSELIAAGCLAKPLTASLLAEAVAGGFVHWSQPVEQSLPLDEELRPRIAGVTVRQLLNHTHGLDGSAIKAVPKRCDGYLDLAALCQQLAAQRVFAPGWFYSYSNVGAWLAGRLLEHIYAESFSRLLAHKLVCFLDAKGLPPCLQDVCPATGGKLALTLSQWLSFLALHLNACATKNGHDRHKQYLAELRDAPVSLPGWNPLEQAACVGWKSYGDVWFGHHSNSPLGFSLLRFNPERQIAIVLAAPADRAILALAGIFGTSLPELVNLKPLRLLSEDECESLVTAPFEGVYAQSQMQLQVTVLSPAVLSVTTRCEESASATQTHIFRAARYGVFVPNPPGIPGVPFIQFIRDSRSESSDYLWNGVELLRKRQPTAH